MGSPIKVTCQYCKGAAKLVDSVAVYKTRSYGLIWLCAPCRAWVGVNKNSDVYAPLGSLANAELRAARNSAHSHLDVWWKRGNIYSRSGVYAALSACMGIPATKCHIGMFDVGECGRVVIICRSWAKLGGVSSTVTTHKET